MRKNFAPTLALAICTVGIACNSATPVHAQRDRADRQEQRQENRARRENMTPEQRQQAWQQRMQNMTPEQRARFEERRQQFEQQRRQEQIASISGEDRQKYLMSSAGVEDAAVQDAIIAFAIEQSQKRQGVTEAALALSTLLADKTATPEAIDAQLTKLTDASKEFRAWKEGALKQLDAKISYSTDPRVKSLLVLVGILGDEASDAGGFNAIFPKGLAGDGDIVELAPQNDNNRGGWGGMGGPGGGGGQNPGDQNMQPGQPMTAGDN